MHRLDDEVGRSFARSIECDPLAAVDTVDVAFMTESDRPAVCRMLEGSDDFPQQLLGYYRCGGGRYGTLVAWSGAKVVGMLTGSFDSDFFEGEAFDSFDLRTPPHAFLVRVHVHESARGAGVGRALIVTYAMEAEARGCTFIGGSVDLSSDPTARRAFFTRLGFSIRDLDNFGAQPSQILSAT